MVEGATIRILGEEFTFGNALVRRSLVSKSYQTFVGCRTYLSLFP